MRRKSKKMLILTGAARFNNKPKAGIAFLEENGLIYHDFSEGVTRPQSLARFLKSSTRLDKKLLGDFISKPENTDVLKAFVGLFEFREVRILVASVRIRILHSLIPRLETHCGCNEGTVGNIPTARGSSADFTNYRDVCRDLLCIRARSCFHHVYSQSYRSRHPLAEIKSQDAVYVLAYSVIMLNTDLHNPQVRVSQYT